MLARATPRMLVALMCLTLAACATASAPPPQEVVEAAPAVDPPPPETVVIATTARMPRSVRAGSVDMMIQRVEQDVSREEVANAVQGLLARAPFCMQWPALWLVAPERRSTFVVRYDLMQRDWSDGGAQSAQVRMEEFVNLGFLTKRDLPDIGPGAVEYTVTDAGRAYLRGAIEPGQRPSFCAPAERRLVELTALEWGSFPCGTLRARFTHVGDAWPSWARTEEMRARLAQTWPPIGETAYGEVSFSRQWFSDPPRGTVNGALVSACLDRDRQRIVGDDLNLAAPSP